MKEGWNIRNFEKCLEKVPKQKSIKSKNYLQFGSFPIISQESIIVSGYSNDETLLYKHNKPVVIFGDHTKNIKYIDFDFIVGADGVHILLTKDDILPKFFYYELCSINIRNLGYARHYKLLKEKNIMYPTSLLDQQRIVSYLDSEFAKIEALKANAEKQLQAAKDLFQAALKELLTPKEGWVEKTIKDVGEVIGGTTPNTNVPEFWNGNNCWISPAELKGSHYLYDSVKKITDLAIKKKNLKLLPVGTVILSSRAPIGKVVINKVPAYCNQGFKCVVCKNDLYNEFLYWFFYGNTDYLNSLGTGATFPEISKGTVENIPINYPPISEQQRIADRLDALSANVKALQTNYTETITLCNDLKQALLKKVFE